MNLAVSIARWLEFQLAPIARGSGYDSPAKLPELISCQIFQSYSILRRLESHIADTGTNYLGLSEKQTSNWNQDCVDGDFHELEENGNSLGTNVKEAS